MTLTIQDLGALGELLGSVAVLATLVYLALQTRQNTMAIGAQLDAAALGRKRRAGAPSPEVVAIGHQCWHHVPGVGHFD